MFVNKLRVQNIDRYLNGFRVGDKLQVILTDIECFKDKLIEIGFNNPIRVGERILPAVCGSITNYNANGRYEILRDLPKEKFYVSQTREIKDWHGDYHSVSVDMEYKRFQREFLNAPSEELTIIQDNNGGNIVASNQVEVNEENKSLIQHIVNLFLELFGECYIVDEELFSRVKTKINRVNWRILPRGEMPWERLKVSLLSLLHKTNIESKEDALNRFEYINNFSPDFVATGNGGFNDYVVFGFKEKNLYVMENSFAGNATYIFKNEWEIISQLTKAEILKESLQEHRLIHRKYWTRDIRNILA